TLMGFMGLLMCGYAYGIWQNSTFIFSLATVISFIAPAVLPFLLNTGTYPGGGVSPKKAAQLYRTDFKLGAQKIKQDAYDGWNQRVLTKPAVEGGGLDWQEMNEKLIKRGLAVKINDEELLLRTSLSRVRERLTAHDPDLPKILSLLRESTYR